MSLVDVSAELPALIRRPGLTDWVVLDSENSPVQKPTGDETGTIIINMDGKKKKKVWAKTLWPNGKEVENGLDRCLRIYPHLQDTGAFFVSVMIKAEQSSMVPVAFVIFHSRSTGKYL